jgi:glycosyltransferase involved in cell wall biosynthesis
MDKNRPEINPKVSVIIPVFNTEDYLEESVRSIMNQTLHEIEIIIINDGSTDSSLSIIKKLAEEDSRIKWFTQPNMGPSVTRNSGIDLANCEYLYFMDSDDVLDSNALRICYKLSKDRNLDFVFFDAIPFSDIGLHTSDRTYFRTFLFNENKVYNGIEVLNKMLNHNIFRASPCLNFINSRLLKDHNLRFLPNIIHEDELFVPQLYLYAERISCVKDIFFKRRIRSGSIMSKKFSIPNIKGYLVVVRVLNNLSKNNLLFRNTIDRLISYILNPAIYNAKELSVKHRYKTFGYCIHHKLIPYLKFKNIIVMLFPFLVTLKSAFKRSI